MRMPLIVLGLMIGANGSGVAQTAEQVVRSETSGNSADARQRGSENTAEIEQRGTGNHASVVQHGSGNRSEISQSAVNGGGHEVRTVQTGSPAGTIVIRQGD